MATKYYRLNVGLTYPTDPKVAARMARGSATEADRAGVVYAPAGAVVSDIPAVSLPWLLDQGLIEEVPVDDEVRE